MYKIQTANAKCKMKPVNAICKIQTANAIYKVKTANIECKVKLANAICNLQTAIAMYKVQTANAKCKVKLANAICNLQTAIVIYSIKLLVAECKAASCVGVTITGDCKMLGSISGERLQLSKIGGPSFSCDSAGSARQVARQGTCKIRSRLRKVFSGMVSLRTVLGCWQVAAAV